ncbi:MAG TPA: RNHCP domain-containing protein [Candidatus Saccharimonadales bacterium]|nr:RNHCP domain-containing protein [Candidatus Saccharimonadales bacterium]
MKHYRKQRDSWRDRHEERLITRKVRQEKGGGFKCSHCRQWVPINQYMGTGNRNHCNACLWSKHVDLKKGDRKAACQAGMRPIGLTFRIEDSLHSGEIMLIHDCSGCEKISINRIAADDGERQILDVFNASFALPAEHRGRLQAGDIYLAGEPDKSNILNQLFGLGHHPTGV